MQIAKNIRFIPETGLGLVSALLIIGNVLLNTTPVLGLPKNTVVATIVTEANGSIVVRPDSKMVYAANNSTNTVHVIDATTNTVTFTIPVGRLPFALAVSPDSSTLYVSNWLDGSVSVVSTANNQVTKTLYVGSNPEYLAVSPDGKYVYVPSSATGFVSIIDTATNTVANAIKVPGSPFQIVFSRSGSTAYVANYIIPTAPRPRPFLSIIDTATQTLSSSIQLSEHASRLGLAVNPVHDKMYLLIPALSRVRRFDTTTNTLGRKFPAPNEGDGLLAAVTPDGQYLYDADGLGGVAMIDVIARKYVSSFRVGLSPYGLAIAPNGKYAYIAGPSKKHLEVAVVDITPQ